MNQRTLINERKASIDKCQAKGGPLNCRYHSGAITDAYGKYMNAYYTGTKEAIEESGNLNEMLHSLANWYKTNADNQDIYFCNKKANKTEIKQLLKLLSDMSYSATLMSSSLEGESLGQLVTKFNNLIGYDINNAPNKNEIVLEPNMQEPFMNMPLNIFNAPGRMNKDGSMNYRGLMTEEEQHEAEEWFKNYVQEKELKYYKQKNIIDDYQNSLKKHYGVSLIPYDETTSTLNIVAFDCVFTPPLKEAMSKKDIPIFWETITARHPSLQKTFYQVMKKRTPKRIIPENITPENFDDINYFSNELLNIQAKELESDYENYVRPLTYLNQEHINPAVSYMAHCYKNYLPTLEERKAFTLKEKSDDPSYDPKILEDLLALTKSTDNPDDVEAVRFFRDPKQTAPNIIDMNLHQDSYCLAKHILPKWVNESRDTRFSYSNVKKQIDPATNNITYTIPVYDEDADSHAPLSSSKRKYVPRGNINVTLSPTGQILMDPQDIQAVNQRLRWSMSLRQKHPDIAEKMWKKYSIPILNNGNLILVHNQHITETLNKWGYPPNTKLRLDKGYNGTGFFIPTQEEE